MSESQKIPEDMPIQSLDKTHSPEVPSDYATTPDGMVFATSPAGTRIVYDRLFLLKCRDSPLSKISPSNLPDIPGVTTPIRSVSRPDVEKIHEERKEIGDYRVLPSRYRQPDVFLFPNVADVNGNYPQLQVPSPYSAKPPVGGPLAQYRQRQAMSRMSPDGFRPIAQLNDPYLVPPPIMDPQYRGVFSPPPVSTMGPPYAPPTLFLHPMQGPAGPIMESTEKLSQLNLWRRSYSRTNGAESLGYTTAKAPQLRSSFSRNEGSFGVEGGYRGSPPFRQSPTGVRPPYRSTSYGSGNLQNPAFPRGQFDSAYDSTFESDLVMVIPDDPSVIACKPAIDRNANITPSIPTMGL